MRYGTQQPTDAATHPPRTIPRAGRTTAEPGASRMTRLRPMRESDLRAVAEIERRSYLYPWPRGLFRRVLRAGLVCRVAEHGRRVVGYGIMTSKGHVGHLMNLCVARDSRNRGLGRKLITHLLTLARRRGVRLVWLEVRPTNRPALALYRSLGFRRAGLRRHYYPQRRGREHAIILARRID